MTEKHNEPSASATDTRRNEPASISGQVHRQLRNAIIRGEIIPGVTLSESEIARQYKTSRQPVREAFIKLAEERLVSIQPQRGTFVVKISVADVLDARFVREAIEVAVVQDRRPERGDRGDRGPGPDMPPHGWRTMFWVGVVPALFTFWIRSKVPESPVWLDRQRRLREAP